MDRADDGVLVGQTRHAWEVLADPDAGDVGLNGPERAANVVGRVRLEVPGVDLAGAADEEEEDATHIAGGIGVRRRGGERQAGRSGRQGAGMEEVASRQTRSIHHYKDYVGAQRPSTSLRMCCAPT